MRSVGEVGWFVGNLEVLGVAVGEGREDRGYGVSTEVESMMVDVKRLFRARGFRDCGKNVKHKIEGWDG